MGTAGYVVAAVVLWLATGYLSACVRFGTWEKNTIVYLMRSDGWGFGYYSLLKELWSAVFAGPWVAIKYAWRAIRGKHAVGFAFWTPKRLSKRLEP